MILQYPLLSLLGILEILLRCGRIDTGDEELLLVVVVEEIPHVGVVNFCHCHVLFHLELVEFAQAARHVHESLEDVGSGGVLVVAVQFNVSFFN
jgi:hypothetical protein